MEQGQIASRPGNIYSFRQRNKWRHNALIHTYRYINIFLMENLIFLEIGFMYSEAMIEKMAMNSANLTM